MSLSQALNQFAQNLGRYLGLIRVLDTVMRGRSPAQTAAIALMHLLTTLRKIRAENIRHCIASKWTC